MLKWRHVIAVPYQWLTEACVPQPVTDLSLSLAGPVGGTMSHHLRLLTPTQKNPHPMKGFTRGSTSKIPVSLLVSLCSIPSTQTSSFNMKQKDYSRKCIHASLTGRPEWFWLLVNLVYSHSLPLSPEGRVITDVREMDFPKLPETLCYAIRGDILSDTDLRAVRSMGNKEGSDIVWTWKCNLNQREKLYVVWQVLWGIRSPILS